MKDADDVKLEVQVRDAEPTDIDRIAQWQVDMAAETEDKPLDRSTVRRGVQAVFDDREKGFYLVAAHGCTPVASMLVTKEWSDWRNGWFWWIQSVFVDADHRRRGIYRALHEALRIRARAVAGVIGLRLYVERENAHAMQTYAAMGMHETAYRLFEEEL